MNALLINLDGLEGKFLTVGKVYYVEYGISSYWTLDDDGVLVEVNACNFQ